MLIRMDNIPERVASPSPLDSISQVLTKACRSSRIRCNDNLGLFVSVATQTLVPLLQATLVTTLHVVLVEEETAPWTESEYTYVTLISPDLEIPAS